MINLILFGPPGSGKGTQAVRIAEKYNIVHISTGDLFRYELNNMKELGKLAKSYMDKGQLVPDEVTVDMLKSKMDRHPDANGFIFDGFPRTLNQADALMSLFKARKTSLTAMLALEVDEDEIVRRIKMRGETSGRADDNDEDIIRNRFAVYKNETQPVFNYFKNLGLATSINGIGDVDKIYHLLVNRIDRALNRL